MTNEYGIYRAQIEFPFFISSQIAPHLAGRREERDVQIMVEADKLDYWKEWFDVVAGITIPNADWRTYQRKVTLTIELNNVFPHEIFYYSPESKARRIALKVDKIEVVDVKIEGMA